MSVWNNGSESNFCDLLLELIYFKKFIPPEIAWQVHFHAQHDTKAITVFIPADWEGHKCLSSSVSLLSGGTA